MKRERPGAAAPFRVSIPASVQVIGEFQDAFGLPAVLVAGGPRVSLGISLREDGVFTVASSPKARPRVLDLAAEGGEAADHLARAAARVAARHGMALAAGADVIMDDRLPRALQYGRRAALAVGWSVCFAAAAGRLSEESGAALALLAQETEAEACGRSALPGAALVSTVGGVALVEPERPLHGQPVYRDGVEFVYAELPDAAAARSDVAARARAAAATLRRYFPHFDPARSTLDDAVPSLADLPDEQAQFIYAMLTSRDAGADLWETLRAEGVVDGDRVGELLDQHHEMLRDHLGLVSESEDRLVDAAINAGALGAKANALEGGGILAFAPGEAEAVRAALEKTGAAAFAFGPDPGMSLEEM